MNQPNKKQFFNYMSNKFGYDFRCEQSYQLLKDVIREADEEEDLKQFVELKDLNKRDSEIYRDYLAEKGIEKTPSEVREHFATIEYGLELVFLCLAHCPRPNQEQETLVFVSPRVCVFGKVTSGIRVKQSRR